MKRQPTFIDLFAGAGGFSCGMIQAGLKCIAALEFSEMAGSTYWANLCLKGWSHLWLDGNDPNFEKKAKAFAAEDTHNSLFEIPDDDWLYREESSPCLNLFCQDITKLSPEEFCRLGGFVPDDIDIIVGGPPCQGFSTSGDRQMDDSRNQLVFTYLEYAKYLQPKFFIIENVPGILTLGKKKGEEAPFPKWIRERANEFGFHLTYDIHNCAEYGVPQNRRRVLFIGTRNDLWEQGKRFSLPKPTHTYSYFEQIEKSEGQLFPVELPTDTEPFVTVFEAIGDLNDYSLSALNKAGQKKEPFGSHQRVSSEEVVTHGKYYFSPDVFNGILVPVGYKGRSIETNKSKEHYKTCSNCGKHNIIVRKKCHYCKQSFSKIITLK